MVAENLLLAFGVTTNDWVKRGIAIAIMACIAAMHVYTKNWGIRLMVGDFDHSSHFFCAQ